MRIAFITESSTRQMEPMKASQFYQGSRSRWVNAIMKYMEVRDFPQDDIFFLSHYGQRIIKYNEIVDPYPVQKFHPRKDHCRQFALKIITHILSYDPLPFVEIHCGKTISDPLIEYLKQYGIEYRLYGDGVPLGAKASFYDDLIEEESNQRKLREITREKRQVSSLIKCWTADEASKIVADYEGRAQLFGIESHIRELKHFLGNFRQKKKDEKKALTDFESSMANEDKDGLLETFLLKQVSLADLHGSSDYERIKGLFGKSVAKFTCYLLKKQYVIQAENRISESLLRMQIALLK